MPVTDENPQEEKIIRAYCKPSLMISNPHAKWNMVIFWNKKKWNASCICIMLMTTQVKYNRTSCEKHRTGQDRACHGMWSGWSSVCVTPSVRTARQLPYHLWLRYGNAIGLPRFAEKCQRCQWFYCCKFKSLWSTCDNGEPFLSLLSILTRDIDIAILSFHLNAPNPDFKVRPFYDAEYLGNG